MEFSFGTLQLTRTDPQHAGTRPLVDTGKKTVVDKYGNVSNVREPDWSETKKMGTFESYLMDSFSEMNSQQVKIGKLQEQMITDPDSVNIQEVTTAMAKAQMSLNLAQNVISRLVRGWEEISQNR